MDKEFLEAVREALKTARGEMIPGRAVSVGVHFSKPDGSPIRQSVVTHEVLTRRGELVEEAGVYFDRFRRLNIPFTLRVGKKTYFEFKGEEVAK